MALEVARERHLKKRMTLKRHPSQASPLAS